MWVWPKPLLASSLQISSGKPAATSWRNDRDSSPAGLEPQFPSMPTMVHALALSVQRNPTPVLPCVCASHTSVRHSWPVCINNAGGWDQRRNFLWPLLNSTSAKPKSMKARVRPLAFQSRVILIISTDCGALNARIWLAMMSSFMVFKNTCLFQML